MLIRLSGVPVRFRYFMAKGKGEKKGGGAGGRGGHEEDQEQKLQAILLADSFNTNFRPISNDMPKVNRFAWLQGAAFFSLQRYSSRDNGSYFRQSWAW